MVSAIDSPLPDPGFSINATRAQEWQPGDRDGLGETPHGEVFASARDGSGTALALALAQDRLRTAAPDPLADTPDQRMWLWVQDREALRRSGRPYRPGLPRALRHRLIHVAADTAEDALFALEEGLRCRELAFVIGEIAGNPKALSFIASRRLTLTAERHGVPLWLVRLDAARELSSARMRWQANAAPSPPPRWNRHAPGVPSWRAELFRARSHPPGEWLLREEEGVLLRLPASNGRGQNEATLAAGAHRHLEGRVASLARFAMPAQAVAGAG
jgi:protein ImuA